jgi:signal transduction histidine kinase
VGERTAEARHVVVIDDDEIMRLSCQEILRKAGCCVEVFESGHAGIERIREARPQLLLVDLKMPGLDGLQVIDIVRKVDPALVIVVITGYATIGTAVEAMKAGAYDFLPKPFTPDELRLIIERGFERWRLARESAELRREKEESERRFVTFVSHQLKSPLAAVKQYLDVLMFTTRAELPERAQLWIGRCQVRIAEMLSLISDWLALSRLERGQLCRRDAASDLGALVARVLDEQREAAEAAGVALCAALAPGLPAVRGDEVSLAMLLGNLVGNAIKYNRRGGSVTVRGASAGDRVSIAVEDTGIGIAEEHLGRLFTEFFRVSREATQGIPGTGLGLAICRKIARELGGEIAVASRDRAGSTFSVELPAARRCAGR